MHASSINRFNVTLVAVVLLVTMFLPMVAIHYFGASVEPGGAAGGEVTVGIAVILRATARRFLRSASTNFMRTTVGAFGRTSARAATRRFVKFAGRLFFSSVVQQSVDEADGVESRVERPGLLHQILSLSMGFAGLCLSFFGILHVVEPEVAQNIMGSAGLGQFELVLLAGVPLLAYAMLHQIFGRLFGVRATYRTEIDGLLLQGYFTGAGSFLPLTTDVEYEGKPEGKRNLAVTSLLGMLVLHGLFVWIGNSTGSEHMKFLGPMFLIYSFVYCFPIKPLEGHFIWSSSKLLWVLVTVPILTAFMVSLPPAFGEIL